MNECQALTFGWQLTLVENKLWRDDHFDPRTVEQVRQSPYLTIPAHVPGNFECDLLAAGQISDPFYSTNMIDLQNLENRHLFYTLTFDADPIETDAGERFLRFEGIDTVADVILNGKTVAHSENMFLPVEIPCRELLPKNNQLIVHIFPVCLHARRKEYELTAGNFAQAYNYEALAIRKAGYMFGWDIMPRAVSAGIWKPVSLIYKQPEHLEQTYLYTASLSSNRDKAQLVCFYSFVTPEDSLKSYQIKIEGDCEDSHFSVLSPCHFTAGNVRFSVKDPCLWYPKNAGVPKTYQVNVTLLRDGRAVDIKTFRFGIRTVRLNRTSTTNAAGEGEFCFQINGESVFVLGTNWVPLDSYPSQNGKRLPKALALLDDVGVNMVRLWGGNIYEDDALFDFCDQHGIMVWHDFSMGCAVYPQNQRFCDEFRREAVFEVRRVRQHPCLVLWAGDNECDLAYSWNGTRRDPNVNRLTREVLPQVICDEDPVGCYLPSSPYLDSTAFKTRQPLSEDHLWGPRDYFKGQFYQGSVCHFASETGYHGCPSPESLKKYIRPEQLWPITERDGNGDERVRDDWLVKSSAMELKPGAPYTYRIPLMTSQVKTMFGAVPDELEDYAKFSQVSQAEAFKYFIERFRLSEWRRTGIIWWNLLDGCPQISDAVVDYYFVKKLAYSYIKRVQAPVCLMFDEPKDGKWTLFGVNDTKQNVTVTYSVRDTATDTLICSGSTQLSPDSSAAISCVNTAEWSGTHVFSLSWEGDAAGSNHYLTQCQGLDGYLYLSLIHKLAFDNFEGF